MNKRRKKEIRERKKKVTRKGEEIKKTGKEGEKERKAEMNNVHVLFAYMHVRESK